MKAYRTSLLCSVALAIPLGLSAVPGSAWASGEPVGQVTTVQPSATINAPGEVPAIVDINRAVSMADIVRTDVNGFVKIEFNDGSQLTVNPGSNVTIDEYVYDRSTNAGTLVMSVGSGVARFVSGNMRKEGIQIRTPTATMGLRGTDIVIRTDGVTSEIEVMDGEIAVVPCGRKDVYVVDKGQMLSVDWSCAVSTGPSGVAGGGVAAAAAAEAGPGPGDGEGEGPGEGGPSGGPGNGNGNEGNAGNGGGNTGGSGPGTGNGGSNNGQGEGASNGGGGSGGGGR